MAISTTPAPQLPDLTKIEASCRALVHEAGILALSHFNPGQKTRAHISWKDGGSPVTAADHAVDAFLADHLKAILPTAHWHSEERPEDWKLSDRALAFVIDPIDGTRQYIDGLPGWCISLALVAQGVPILGIVHSPFLNETLHGFAGGGAFFNGTPLPKLSAPGETLRITGPKHAAEFLRTRISNPAEQLAHISALARRVSLTITGAHDLALARPGAHDWDIAAADCLLREVGGCLRGIDGQHLLYPLDGSGLPALLAGETSLIEKIIARS